MSEDCKPKRSQMSGHILFLLILFPLGYLLAICFSVAVTEMNKFLDKPGDSTDGPGSGTFFSSGNSNESGGVCGATRNKGE